MNIRKKSEECTTDRKGDLRTISPVCGRTTKLYVYIYMYMLIHIYVHVRTVSRGSTKTELAIDPISKLCNLMTIQ